jgi:hypothetical protein
MNRDLAAIRYDLTDTLVNDELIQSKEDLIDLKKRHKERFVLFHKLRKVLNLDMREPSPNQSEERNAII